MILKQNHDEVEWIVPTQEENKVLGSLDDSYTKISEMTGEERAYLNAAILRGKPKRVLEIGVSAGSSSIVILNALKEIPGSHLFSIDYLDYWYRDTRKKAGHLVDDYPALKTNWTLFTGALSLRFMEKIADGGRGRPLLY
jgi:predicted O-methyltransferase YrrM